jgi:hypothetical protein
MKKSLRRNCKRKFIHHFDYAKKKVKIAYILRSCIAELANWVHNVCDITGAVLSVAYITFCTSLDFSKLYIFSDV